ncbi:hypothetical protein TRICI_005652 [Trichomonascus ciferrii]|uniref:Major facilitator superfamily (MFS) profile domain-containing protein n=1 Tax=Trichomonascus ciferrii TaxID=44093 RepID=A0A642UQM2_9ASCO|nr:hypothetical protein TRICI_005652 [Trichomonascus ciferrii]
MSSSNSEKDVYTEADREKEAATEISQNALPTISRKRNRLLLHRIDRVVLPIVSLLYLLAFLDRSNIGNAAAAGMTEDLGLHGNQLNVGVSVFYVLYVLVETPATVLVKKVGTSRMLAIVMTGWSLVVVFSGFMKNYAGLLVTRLLLGLFEGCLFPTITIYLATIYLQDELNTRLAYFFGASALSGAFGGLLAWAILQMEGVGGKKGWQWLYIIEGLISFIGVVVAYFGLPDDIEKAWFLGEEDRQLVRQRHEMSKVFHGNQQFSWTEVRRAFADPKLWMFCVSQFCSDIILYGFSTFLPAIIKTLGYTDLSVQYMTIPVYIVGAVSFLGVAMIADRTGFRVGLLIPCAFLCIIGYALLLGVTNTKVMYFGTFLVAMGLYVLVGLNIGWLNNNTAPHFKRATALGFTQSVANTAGIVAGQIYPDSSAPRYKLGHYFSMFCAVGAVIVYVITFLYLKIRNKQKQKRLDNGEYRPSADGDDSDEFFYIY